MNRSVGSNIVGVVVLLAGLATLGGGMWALKEADSITPPTQELAALDTQTAVADPQGADSTDELRHDFVQFPTAGILGDSFATGYGTDRGRGWVEQVGGEMCWSIAAKSAELETGYTSSGGSATTTEFLNRVEKITLSDPDVVLVEGGVFDFPAPSELIYKNASDVFQLLRATLPDDTDIVVIGPVASPTVDQAQLARIITTIADAAKDVGVTFIDPVEENWLPDRTYFISGNNIQPNDRGHTEFAARLAEALRSLGIPAGCQ